MTWETYVREPMRTLSHRPGSVGVRGSSPLSSTLVTSAGSVPEPSRANADDRLPLASLGRVEGRKGIVEGRDVADVRPQSSVPHPLDDLTQLGAVGLDDEVDRQAVRGPRLV